MVLFPHRQTYTIESTAPRLKYLLFHRVEYQTTELSSACQFYGRERIGESNYHDSQGEFCPKLKQCLTDWTKEALPQSFRTRAF